MKVVQAMLKLVMGRKAKASILAWAPYAEVASVVLCMIYLLRKGNIFTVELKKIRFHKHIFLQVVRYGLPSGIAGGRKYR